MILNRPGCELLECFLRDLAFILKSYNIDVKLTLLERNQLDAEGGIASYMQRNIDKCDYVLLMFTENTQGKSMFSFYIYSPGASRVLLDNLVGKF